MGLGRGFISDLSEKLKLDGFSATIDNEKTFIG